MEQKKNVLLIKIKTLKHSPIFYLFNNIKWIYSRNIVHIKLKLLARRRAAAKRKKLKNLGKSKSTDTEEEDADEDCGDDGEFEYI